MTIGNDTSIKEKHFWSHAKCTHSYPRFSEGAKKYRQNYDLMFGVKKFIRMRRYIGKDGEIKRTVEIEI